MKRPDRSALLKSFFQELGDTITKADTEEQIALNTRACEVILHDHIKEFDRFYADKGPGVLCINLANKGSQAYYLTDDDIRSDLKASKGIGQEDIHDMLQAVLQQVESANFSQIVLVMLIDNSRTTLLPIPREYPASGIQELQERLTV